MLAEDIRGYMAKLGFRTMGEMVGHVERLKFQPAETVPKAKTLDFAAILTNAQDLQPASSPFGGTVPQNFDLEKRMVSYLLMLYQQISSILSLYIA